MASGEKRLTALQITKLMEPGRYADGGGLYLEIDKKGNKRWLLRLQVAKKRRDFGLGALSKVPLATARELAQEYRETAQAGGDPSKERKERLKVDRPPLVSECAKGFHAAMPYSEVPAFLDALEGLEAASDTVRLLLEFVILTACRLGEARLAVWGEFDLANAVWDVPVERMKAGKSHRVTLSDRAIEILNAMAARKSNHSDYIFPGMKPHRPVSDMAITMLYRRLEVDATTHGFRSSFRDWVAETRPEDRDAAEAQLAHSLGGKVETAYLRTTLFERRRELVLAWADFLMAEA